MVKCYTINNDWIVEVDGIVRGRFAYSRFGRDACFLAAREANKWRLV